MPTLIQGDVVKVPFPYTSRPTRQSRPALVISAGDITDGNASGFRLIWVVMITSAQNRGWPGDVALDDLSGTGLPAPSVIRTAKIATIETGDATRLGCIGEAARAEVLGQLRGHLGIDPVR